MVFKLAFIFGCKIRLISRTKLQGSKNPLLYTHLCFDASWTLGQVAFWALKCWLRLFDQRKAVYVNLVSTVVLANTLLLTLPGACHD